MGEAKPIHIFELVYLWNMKKRLPKINENQQISIRLEQFDDIFSDFDIRDYSKRALSVDFLDEIRRASIDKDESGVELVLYVPEKERDELKEQNIKERLMAHFERHYGLTLKEKRKTLNRGWSMVFLGVISMLGATLIVSEGPSSNFFLSFLLVLLEPAALFLLWEGMDQIIFSSKEIDPELMFYKKMARTPHTVDFKSF